MIGMFLGDLILLFASLTLVKLKKSIVGNSLTISDCLIIPYICVLSVQLITCYVLHLTPASFDYWIYYFVFFVVVVVFDVIGKMVTKDAKLINCNPNTDFIKSYDKVIGLTCIISSLYSLIHMATILSRVSNIYLIVQEQVQSKYASGLNFYVRLILMIGTVYYWGIKEKTKRNIAFGVICFIPNALTFVKSIILLSCMGVLICKIKKRLRITLKTGVLVACIGIVVFFGVNMIEMGVYDSKVLERKETYQYILSKMSFYFVSGVQSFSQNILNDPNEFRKVDNVTIAPFTNFIAKLGLSESIRPVTTISQRLWYSEIMGRNVSSNVNGYVGTLYLYNGFFLGNIINAFWVVLSSILERKYEHNDNFLSALSALFSAAFTLGWFDYYFSQTFWFYLLFLGVAINYMASIIKCSNGGKNGYTQKN